MRTIRRIVPALLVLVALATMSFTTKDRDGVTLKLKPQQGKTYTITYKNIATNTMEVQGQSMNQSIEMEMRQTFTANEVSNTQSVFKTQIDALRMSTSVMGMTIEYDSEHPEKNSPLFGDLGSELKQPQNVTYDASGHVIDGTDLSTGQLDAVILQFPDEELSVGSKWSTKKTQNISGIDYILDVEYEVVSISKKSVDLTFNGVYRLDCSEEIAASGTYNGTCSIDPQTGIMTSSTGTMSLSMVISEKGITIPARMTATTTITVK